MVFAVNSELCHHGIKGQRWGIRRYQNEDGTLTEAGRKRYGSSVENVSKKNLYRQAAAFQKAHPDSESMKYYAKKQKEAEKHAIESKAGKEFQSFNQRILDMAEEAEKSGGALYVDQATRDRFIQLQDAYYKAADDYLKQPKTLDKFSSLILRDLGYEDTAKGRVYATEVLAFTTPGPRWHKGL